PSQTRDWPLAVAGAHAVAEHICVSAGGPPSGVGLADAAGPPDPAERAAQEIESFAAQFRLFIARKRLRANQNCAERPLGSPRPPAQRRVPPTSSGSTAPSTMPTSRATSAMPMRLQCAGGCTLGAIRDPAYEANRCRA